MERGRGEIGSPFQVHRGDVEDHALEPQDHEEALGEGAVANALAITSRLREPQKKRRQSEIMQHIINKRTMLETITVMTVGVAEERYMKIECYAWCNVSFNWTTPSQIWKMQKIYFLYLFAMTCQTLQKFIHFYATLHTFVLQSKTEDTEVENSF